MRVSTTEPTVERYSSVWTLSMDPPVSVVPVGVVFSVVASVVALPSVVVPRSVDPARPP
jgi:hypothetical protein